METRFKLNELMGKKSDRDGKRVTFRAISKEAGVSTSTLHALSKGSMKQVGTKTLARLVAYFDCSYDDLMELVRDTNINEGKRNE